MVLEEGIPRLFMVVRKWIRGRMALKEEKNLIEVVNEVL